MPSPEAKREKRMNLPQTHVNKLFYFIGCNRYWVVGKIEVFGQRSGAKALICAAIIYNVVIGFFIGFIPG